MRTASIRLCGICLPTLLLFLPFASALAGDYTRLERVTAKVLNAAEAYPGGNHEAKNLVDGDPRTEYSSNGKGLSTFVEFELPADTLIAGVEHVDRNDPATLEKSEIVFSNTSGAEVARLQINHVNTRAGTSFASLPTPVRASKARWAVTKLGSPHGTVGGAEISFLRFAATDASPVGISIKATTLNLLERTPGGLRQPVRIEINHPYAEPAEATLQLPGSEDRPVKLAFGRQTFEISVPAVDAAKTVELQLTTGSRSLLKKPVTLQPVRKIDVYLLPHSHVDIGYTELQAEVEKKQNQNIETGLRLGRESANYPIGSAFKWNVEVLWPVENYLRAATPQKRAEFIEAVKSGRVGLDAFYCNILTGLCRPEELLQLMRYATQLSELCGVPIESAMISDVPGYTWSLVAAMAQAGVKYFSFAPNYFDRMGGTMKEWQNRPFWWKGPDGTSRVLCWCPSRGYALGHIIGDGDALAKFMPSYMEELESGHYPYDITHLRWNVHGDNGSPDEKLADVVRDWNLRYAAPRLIITTTATAFKEFERRYGSSLPEFSGDYTPYWEDGAASSARETALNRVSADRLSQAQTIWALRGHTPFPAEEFQKAWHQVLLYSEHTWGAHNSISQPDLPFVLDQWRVKQGFALDADRISRDLLSRAISGTPGAATELDVYNTSSWERTGLVTVPADLATSGSHVADLRGRTVPSQHLSTGEWVFLASKVPAFSRATYRILPGEPKIKGSVHASGNTLEHPDFKITVNPETGGIQSLYSKLLKLDLVETGNAAGFNDFFYLPGSDLKGLQRNARPVIRIKENGPLVASLVVESSAPGCKSLTREIRVCQSLDHVELINTIDKLPIRAKEGLHFGFGFNIPGGKPLVDVGLAAVRPEIDQIPASCKNWFSAQRWVDISNDRFGVTWSPVDAPLVQLGGITANLVGSQTDYRVWREKIEPTQTLYSWVMNNHWHTNYRAEQDGPVIFRFDIRPHKGTSPQSSAMFGLDRAQPLIACRADSRPLPSRSFQIPTGSTIVSTLKPADDGCGVVLRLYGSSGQPGMIPVKPSSTASKVWISNMAEQRVSELKQPLSLPAWGLTTLRVD